MQNNLKQIINDRGLKAKWISKQLGVHETEPRCKVKDLYPDYKPQ